MPFHISETCTYSSAKAMPLKFSNHTIVKSQTCNKPILLMSLQTVKEFTSHEFEEFYKQYSITHQVTAPYTPQQNSVAEQGNRTTSEKAQALLKEENLPSTLWGEAVTTEVLYKNITPTCKIKWKSPYELCFGKPFNYSCLRVFGCKAYMNIPKERRGGKFADTSDKGILHQLGIPNWWILTPGNWVEFSQNFVERKTVSVGN